MAATQIDSVSVDTMVGNLSHTTNDEGMMCAVVYVSTLDRYWLAQRDTGTSTALGMYYSDDGGATWTDAGNITTGSSGTNRAIRMCWDGFEHVWISFTDAVNTISMRGLVANSDTVSVTASVTITTAMTGGENEYDHFAYYDSGNDKTYIYGVAAQFTDRDHNFYVRSYDHGTAAWDATVHHNETFKTNNAGPSTLHVKCTDESDPWNTLTTTYPEFWISCASTLFSGEYQLLEVTATSLTSLTITQRQDVVIGYDTPSQRDGKGFAYDYANDVMWAVIFEYNGGVTDLYLQVESVGLSSPYTHSGDTYTHSSDVIGGTTLTPVGVETRLWGNKLYVFYYAATLNSVWSLSIYDIETDTWQSDAYKFQFAAADAFGIEKYGTGVRALASGSSGTSGLSWTVIDFAIAATWNSPEDGSNADVTAALPLDWTFNAPGSETQTHYRIKRVIDATTTEYWDGTNSEWVSTETAATKVASSTSSKSFPAGWGDAGTETSHVYYVQTWNSAGFTAGYSAGLTLYTFSNESTVKGYSLPRPIKRQQDLNATLRSNQDYSLSWINTYVPAYGDLNDDLYLRAGVRPGGSSTMRNMVPPVAGQFDVGNNTTYFATGGFTDVYRTNEYALSSEKAKRFMTKRLGDSLGFVLEVNVEQFAYIDESRMGDSKYRFGLVAEDVIEWIRHRGIDPHASAFVTRKDDSWYLNYDQLVPVLWQAIQELYDYVDQVVPPGQKRRPVEPVHPPRDENS